MMNCPVCGRALPAPTVKFCPYCGAACQSSAAPEPTYDTLREPSAAYPSAQPAAKQKSAGKMPVIAAACVGVLIVGVCCGIGILHSMNKTEHSAESSLTAATATAYYSFLDDAVIPEYGILQTDTALNIGDCSGVLSSYITEDGREMVIARVSGETLYLDRYRQSEEIETDESVTYPDFFSAVYDVSPAPFVIEIRDGVVYVNGREMMTLDSENENGKLAEVTVGDNADSYRDSTYIFRDRTPMRDRIKPVPQPVHTNTTPKTEPPRTESTTRTATSAERETTTTETTTVTTTAVPQPVSYLAQYQPVLEQALAQYGYPTADQTDDGNSAYKNNNGANGLFVRLIDFDNDGTEELYLAHQDYGSSNEQFSKIYTVSGGSAVMIQDFPFWLIPVDHGDFIMHNSRTGEYYLVCYDYVIENNESNEMCWTYLYTFRRKTGNTFTDYYKCALGCEDGRIPPSCRSFDYFDDLLDCPLSLTPRDDGERPRHYGYSGAYGNNQPTPSGTLSLRDIDRIQKAT